MPSRLYYFCISAVIAVTFFSLGLLASHQKQDVLHYEHPVPSSLQAAAPDLHMARPSSEPQLKVENAVSLSDYVMPGSDRFSEAYVLFSEAWDKMVVSRIRDIYDADKISNLPKSCSQAWGSFVEGQHALADQVAAKFANLGGDFLGKLDSLVNERNGQAIEKHEREVEEKKKNDIKALHELQAEKEGQLRKEATQKLIDANMRIRADKNFVPSASRKHLAPKPEEIVILSASDYSDTSNYRWRLTLEAIENRDAYAAYHGYRHVFLNFSKYDAAKSHVAHPCWLKLPAIQETFVKYPETKWLWWLDMDAIIWNGNIKLEDHVLHPDMLARRIVPDLYLTDTDERHYNGGKTPLEGEFNTEDALFIFAPDIQSINAGSFFVKNTPQTRSMIEFWGDPEYIYNDKHEGKFGLKEQDAFVKLYLRHKVFRDTTAIVPQALFNAYGPDDSFPSRQALDGDLAVHFAGRSGHDNYYEIWDDVMRSRILPNGSRFDPSFKAPAKWAPAKQ